MTHSPLTTSHLSASLGCAKDRCAPHHKHWWSLAGDQGILPLLLASRKEFKHEESMAVHLTVVPNLLHIPSLQHPTAAKPKRTWAHLNWCIQYALETTLSKTYVYIWGVQRTSGIMKLTFLQSYTVLSFETVLISITAVVFLITLW